MITRFLLIAFLSTYTIFGQSYPDQYYSYEKDSLMMRIESLSGMEVSADGKSVVLSEGIINGSVIFKPDSSEYPFNRGLPSWNGHVQNDKSSFKVLIRFYKNNWSTWLTIGYWKNNIWSSYGSTSYSGGEIEIDVDYAVLKSYYSKWQFEVVMRRTDSAELSPSLHKLSFFASDQKTTDDVNISSIVADKPASIFIDTEHFYQYSLDPVIGGDICSPTSVSMVLRSYDIEVDPLQFARDNYDTYWGMFGIWPKAVQNAAEYDLDGQVSRYRTWSQARDILAAGGRVVMSVGSPLYPNGHLMMLAGFDAAGNPIVHDPARSNGYSYMWGKTSLSQSWFNKGGVAYTFFPSDSASITSIETYASNQPDGFYLSQNYPNPFNPSTNIIFQVPQSTGEVFVSLKVYNILGKEISTLINEEKAPGEYKTVFDASNLPTGVYIYSLNVQTSDSKIVNVNRKMLYLK